MTIDIITLFPQQISDFLNYSIIKRAMDQKLVEIKFHDLRKWAVDKRRSVDDKPYGGGKGMILRCEPVVNAIAELRSNSKHEIRNSKQILNSNDKNSKQDSCLRRNDSTIIRKNPLEIRENPDIRSNNQDNLEEKQQGYQELVAIFDARGKTFNQKMAFEFAKLDHLILICGHYEGFDERILKYVDMAISIGDFVLTGGEIPALAVVDAVTRLLPGVLKEGVVENESFSENSETEDSETVAGETVKRKNIEYPQFTRPEEFEGHKVPAVLLSGNHEEVEKWRKSGGR